MTDYQLRKVRKQGFYHVYVQQFGPVGSQTEADYILNLIKTRVLGDSLLREGYPVQHLIRKAQNASMMQIKKYTLKEAREMFHCLLYTSPSPRDS